MAINKDRIYQNINRLELVIAFLQKAANDEMTMVEVGRSLNLKPMELNYELENCFSRYFKKASNLTISEFKHLINAKDSPSTRLLKAVFGYDKSDNVVFPYVDEDNFWSVIKANYPDNYYDILSMYNGYNVEKPMSFEKIANKFGCTKMWVNDIYRRAINNFNTALLYDIYNYEYINKKAELMQSDEYNTAKHEYELLLTYMSKVDDIKKLNEYIKANFPEVSELDFTKINDMFSTPITELNLSSRLVKVLSKNNINTLSDIYMTSAIAYANMPNFGKIKSAELLEVIIKRNDAHPNRDALIKNLSELLNK